MNVKVHSKYAEGQVNELRRAFQNGKVDAKEFRREMIIMHEEGIITLT